MASTEKVGVLLDSHDNTTLETTEEALVIVRRDSRSKLRIGVHQYHKMRAGNIDCINSAMTAIGPHMDIVTLCGWNKNVNDNTTERNNTIKPLGEGDYDPKKFVRTIDSLPKAVRLSELDGAH